MAVRSVLATLILLFVAALTQAQVTYDELTDGDLGDPASPTALGFLGLGTSSVTGTLDNPASFDADSFTFSVANGQQLTNVYFSSMTGLNHYFALNEGSVDTGNGPANFVSTLISSTDVMTNILDGTINDLGGSGVTNPLEAGTYQIWFQETDGSSVDYSINLQTVAVPEPVGLTLLFLGVIGALFHRR